MKNSTLFIIIVFWVLLPIYRILTSETTEDILKYGLIQLILAVYTLSVIIYHKQTVGIINNISGDAKINRRDINPNFNENKWEM